MKKISSFFQQILLGVIIGIVLGIFILVIFNDSFYDNFGMDTMIYFIVMMGLSFILQIIIHEGGHLLFGYLKQFKFISFRIGSYVITKESGKLKLSRYHLAGTAGQCLLEPSKPDYKSYIVYLLGGGISNLVFALLFLGIGILSSDLLLDIFSFSMFALGLLLGLTNLIPLDLGIPNDGYNVYWLMRNSESEKSFYQQLMISKEMAEGKGLNEINEEYFEIYENANLNNPLNMCIKTNKASRLIFQEKYEDAKRLLERLKLIETSDVFKKSIIQDLVLIELLTSENIDVNQYLDEKQKKYMSSNKNDISSLLNQYGIECLVNKNENQAMIALKYFNDVCKTYPYQGIVCDLKEIQRKIEERKS